jgi:hypothetical protein
MLLLSQGLGHDIADPPSIEHICAVAPLPWAEGHKPASSITTINSLGALGRDDTLHALLPGWAQLHTEHRMNHRQFGVGDCCTLLLFVCTSTQPLLLTA